MVRILHVHGVGLQPGRVFDYPCEVISLSDRLPGNPSLADLRKLTDRCLMGGLDETKIQERILPSLAGEIDPAAPFRLSHRSARFDSCGNTREAASLCSSQSRHAGALPARAARA
jgi:hypothetical protein